ncbi:MAG: sialidase family protein [Bacteroidota bacterium]
MRFLLVAALGLAACGTDPSPPTQPAAPAGGEVAVPADSGSLAPRLALAPDGRPVLSWVEPTAGGHALRMVTWTGSAWSEPGTADAGDRWFVNWADTPGVVPLADGRMLAHVLSMHPDGDSPYAYDIRLTAANGDTSLLHDDGVAAEHGFVSWAPLPGEQTGMVWLDGRHQTGGHGPHSAAMTLRYASVSPDGSRTAEAELDARVCDCCPTALAATASGLVAAYRDRSRDEIRDVAVVRLSDGTWTQPVVPHPDGWEIAGCPVNGPALAASGDRVALAWFSDADSARVSLSLSEDGGATWGERQQVDGGRPLGRVDVAVLDDGSPVVSWLELTSDDTAEVRIQRFAGTTTSAQTVAEIPASRASGIPQLASLGDRVLVVWTDPEAGTIRSAVLDI